MSAGISVETMDWFQSMDAKGQYNEVRRLAQQAGIIKPSESKSSSLFTLFSYYYREIKGIEASDITISCLGNEYSVKISSQPTRPVDAPQVLLSLFAHLTLLNELDSEPGV